MWRGIAERGRGYSDVLFINSIMNEGGSDGERALVSISTSPRFTGRVTAVFGESFLVNTFGAVEHIS